MDCSSYCAERSEWPSASPRTFAWGTRAYHERQQTISHRRYFVACRGRDWPLKTASTVAVRAREARPSGGKVAEFGLKLLAKPNPFILQGGKRVTSLSHCTAMRRVPRP